MQVARCLAVAAAAYAAQFTAPSVVGILAPLTFLGAHGTWLARLPTCFLGLWLVREVNSLLNAWAENRWSFSTDKSSWRWNSEVAVVTGGSTGIGAMVVKKLTSYGIRVAVLDVEPLSAAFQKEEEDLVSFYPCDITVPHQVHLAAQAVRSDHGSPSILINNAGVGNANTILETSPERLQTLFSVNLLSHWYTVQEFLPDMITNQKGHIMSTSSMSAFVGLAGAAEYTATKVGLIAFHEALTQELKHRYRCPQIKTSIVYPTWTRTRLVTTIEDQIRRTRAPIMEPKDVAKAMVNQIIAARSGQLLLGPRLAATIRALPIWLQELIRDRLAQVVTGNTTTAVTLAS